MGEQVLAYPSKRSASSTGRLSIGQWPLSISSGVILRRSRTSRRIHRAGNSRSSRQSRNRVGTSGHTRSGHAYDPARPDGNARVRLMASAARARGTSW